MPLVIPCTTGTVALYQEAAQIVAVPVEGWDGNGTPYVAGAAALVTAASRTGFLRLEYAGSSAPRVPSKIPVLAGARETGRKDRAGA